MHCIINELKRSFYAYRSQALQIIDSRKRKISQEIVSIATKQPTSSWRLSYKPHHLYLQTKIESKESNWCFLFLRKGKAFLLFCSIMHYCHNIIIYYDAIIIINKIIMPPWSYYPGLGKNILQYYCHYFYNTHYCTKNHILNNTHYCNILTIYCNICLIFKNHAS